MHVKSQETLNAERKKNSKKETFKQEILLKNTNTRLWLEKLNSILNSCDNIRKDIIKTTRNASKKLQKQYNKVKGYDDEIEIFDKDWKIALNEYKKMKNKKNRLSKNLDSILFPDIKLKNPNEYLKLDTNKPQRSLVSDFDIHTSRARLILSKTKRHFGEISNEKLLLNKSDDKIIDFIVPKNQDLKKSL